MNPVPTKKAMPEPSISPKDIGVPSSRSWKPTTPLRRRTQSVAVIAPRWTAVKPCKGQCGAGGLLERGSIPI